MVEKVLETAVETEVVQDNKNERLKEITDRLEQGIKDLFEGERFKEYLGVMAKFHNYSYKNTVLISQQNPAATKVAGFNAWKNKFGRSVNKGEKGIQIIAPAPFKVQKEQEKIDEDTGLVMRDAKGEPIMEEVEITIPYFKVVSVFDVSQTDGKELPTLGANELYGGVEDFDKFFEALKTVSPAPIEYEKISGGSKGYYDHENKRIAVNEGMSELQSMKTAIHEIAHAKLHDRDLIKSDLAEPKDKRTMEVEAEAIAYTVCQHYGIDTSDYSFAYIAEWGTGKDMSELKSSLETIRTTANEIITKVDEQFFEQAKTQEQTVENNENNEPVKPEKQSNIIGNTPYKDIEEKNYFKFETAVALTIAAELEKQGVPFSGRTGKSNTTLTIGGADVARYKEIEKDFIAQTPPEVPKEKLDIIGTVNFTEIENKSYFKLDSVLAVKVAEELQSQGFRFSGRVNGDTTTFTLEKADMEKYKAVVVAVKTAQAQQRVADKFPEPEMPSKTLYNYKILQHSDSTDNRKYRFSSLKDLESFGLEVANAKYELKYAATLETSGSKEQLLENLFVKFNEDVPADFMGHGLAVGDVIVLDDGNNQTTHFCDSFGFVEIADIKVEIPPVYLGTYEQAFESGEDMLFQNSNKLNNECAKAIDTAINKHRESTSMPGAAFYDLKSALADVTAEYGAERVSAVTAHTVNKHEYDGRLSKTNKEWAQTVETPKVEYIPLDTHLAIFDGFVNYVREAHVIEQEKAEIIGKMIEDINQSELEDYGGEAGLAEIEKTMRAKPVEVLRDELASMEKQRESDFTEHVAEREKFEKPASELTELRGEVKENKEILDDKPPEKPSIKARIAADKKARAAKAKTEPTPEKTKKNNIERD